MDKDINDIDKLFHDAIEPLEDKPGKQVWENISQHLDQEEAKLYKRKFSSLKRLVVVLLLLLIGMGVFQLVYFNNSNKQIRVAKDKKNMNVENKNEEKRITKEKGNKNVENRNVISNSKDNSNTVNGNSKEKLALIPGVSPVENNAISSIEKVENKTASIKNSTKNHKISGNNRTEVTKTNLPIKIYKSKKLFVNVSPAGFDEFDEKVNDNNSDNTIPEIIYVKRVLVEKVNFPGTQFAVYEGLQAGVLPIIVNTGKRELAAGITENEASKLTDRFTVTAFFAPEYEGYKLEDNRVEVENEEYDTEKEIRQREKLLFSSSAGVMFGYKFKKHWAIQTGTSYSVENIIADDCKIFAAKDDAGNVKYRYNTSEGYGYISPEFSTDPEIGDSIYAKSAKVKIKYISVPLVLKYGMGSNRFRFNPGVGISFNFLTNSTVEAQVKEKEEDDEEDEVKAVVTTPLEGLKKININLVIIPEIQYMLTKKWAVSFMPYFKCALMPVNKKNTVVRSYPYTIGAGLGVVYRF